MTMGTLPKPTPKPKFFDTWVRHKFVLLGPIGADEWNDIVYPLQARNDQVIADQLAAGHDIFECADLHDKWDLDFDYKELKYPRGTKYMRSAEYVKSYIRGSDPGARKIYTASVSLGSDFEEIVIWIGDNEITLRGPRFSIVGPMDDPYVEQVKQQIRSTMPKVTTYYTILQKQPRPLDPANPANLPLDARWLAEKPVEEAKFLHSPVVGPVHLLPPKGYFVYSSSSSSSSNPITP